MVKTLLTICAHNDDQIIGAGGTLAKYAKNGWRIRTIICSYGEKSHPHLPRDEVIKKRMQEAQSSDKILGGKGFVCLGIQDGKFRREFKEKNASQQLTEIIAKEEPFLIFTHSKDDFHPDHRAVHAMVRLLVKMGVITCPVFTFDVWTPLGFSHSRAPKLYVDVSGTFQQKVDALMVHKSQRLAILNVIWSMYLRAIWTGWRRGCRYAEVFYKLL